MRVTHLLLAGLALAATGCLDSGGGPFSDDSSDDRDFDGVVNEADCAPDDLNRWTLRTAYPDGDGDGFGAGAAASICVGGTQTWQGYSTSATDCNDAYSAAWQPMDRYVDADHDDVGTGERVTICAGTTTPWGYSDSTGDCAPDDGTRWRELAYLHVDGDRDGYTLPGVGVVCSGSSLPPGFALEPAGVDCDDTNAASFVTLEGYADADLDGHGLGEPAELCTGGALPSGYGAYLGDCAPADGSAWQELYYSWVDLDRDGYTIYSSGVVCSGYGLPAGHATVPSSYGDDCDDGDRGAWTRLYAYPDADGDGFGAGNGEYVCTGGWLPPGWLEDLFGGTDCNDADRLAWRSYAYSYRDADGDGHRTPSSGTVCYGTSFPAGYFSTASAIRDCDDADPDLFQWLSGGLDADGDGHGAPPAVTYCTAGSLPSGVVPDATDCAADDPTSWQAATVAYADRDGDGHTVRETGAFCFGDVPPSPYLAVAAGNDCDESDATAFRWVVLYADDDGDGVGAPPRWIPCVGAALPAGWSIFGFDEDDADATVQANAEDEVLFTLLE